MMRHRVPVIIVGLLIAVTAAGAATRTVPGQYPTIQAAVNAASPGDTIVIAAGVYSEHVAVSTDSLTIKGVNRDTVIIDATQTPPARLPGIWLNSVNGCKVCSLTIRNAALGYVSGDVGDQQYAILLSDSDYNVIQNVRTLNSGAYEIFLWDDSDSNTVQDCILDGFRDATYHSLDGIFSSGGSVDEGGRDLINNGNVFKCNTISNVVFGISLTASDSSQILCNTVHAKASTYWTLNGFFSYGVNLFASSDNEVRDNTIDTPIIGVRMRDPLAGDSYVYAGPPDNNLVTGNAINLSALVALSGVNIRGGSNNDISRNAISGTGIASSAGIRLDLSVDNPTTGNSIFGNDIHDNLIGILNSTGANSAHYNNIHGNTVFGISNLDALNTFDAENNWWGAATGPGPVGPGTGDNVSLFVDFTPFLTAPVPQATTSVQLEGAAAGPFCRDITFHLRGTGLFSPTTIKKCITFTGGMGTATLLGLPANTAFSCIDAKDEVHTLVSTKALTPVVGGYTVSFTGVDKLLGGDLQNDDVDDVWDFGILAAQYLTTCHPYPPSQLDADISGDGTVGNEDFLILYSHFLTRGDPPCGMTTGQLPVPKTKISVAQLAALIGSLADARKADLNQDGCVTTTDAQLFYLRNILNKH